MGEGFFLQGKKTIENISTTYTLTIYKSLYDKELKKMDTKENNLEIDLIVERASLGWSRLVGHKIQ